MDQTDIQGEFHAHRQRRCPLQFRDELEAWMRANDEKMTFELIGYGKAKPKDFQVPFLDFVLQMIEVGPTSSHVEYIFNLNDSEVDFFQYLQYKPDPGMEWDGTRATWKDFEEIHQRPLQVTMSSARSHHDFIDVYMYFITAFNTREENIRKQMQSFAYWIELKYDRNVFKDIKDVGLLKRHLADIRKVVLAPEYPQADDIGEASKSMVYHLLKTVSDGSSIEERQTVRGACSQAHTSVDNIGDETFLAIFFARPVVDHVLCTAMGTSRDHVVLWIEMMKALLKHPTENCMRAVYDAVNDKDKLLKWKDVPLYAVAYEVTSKLEFNGKELDDMVSLCLRCQQGAFMRDDDTLTAYYSVYMTVSGQLYQWVSQLAHLSSHM
ncbi:hypothetical protein C0Q70_19879 [Pomacea canaliculata]|uniref:Uncharacterized protein n=1 Tax=Pomacea canaliculata TaxID=400727 RepID=A0A2T7NDZ8_POMCA|nr:hypothetical protein C0Q70_19879 [Pomacea canaliculata]